MVLVLIVMAIIYLPIMLLIFLSFADGMQYYAQLFTNGTYLEAIGNTILIAIISSLIATIIATMAATGILYMRKKSKAATMALNQLPVINADIVTSFGLVLLFVALGLSNAGLCKLILAHTLISLPFCLLTILPKIRQLDINLIDAALDLGASPFKAFTSVVVPQLLPTMLNAFLLGFTLSLDDFVITQYNNSGISTISTVVYGAISRRDIPNAFKALTTIIFLVILVVLVVLSLRNRQKQKPHHQRMFARLSKQALAIIISVVLVLSGGGLALGVALTYTPRSSVLKIYNWEDYIETDLINEFQTYYREKTGDSRFKIEYHTFTDNEELYTKIKSQKADYDLIFPSEYMVEKMRDEGLLKTIDLTQLTNFGEMQDEVLDTTRPFWEVADHADQAWSLPYIYGTLGIIYDTVVIEEMSAKTGFSVDDFEELLATYGWGVLFGDGGTTAYKGRITMKKSARDTIGIAMLYSQQNTTDYFDNLQDILNMQGDYTLAMAEKVLADQIRAMNPTYENDNGKRSFQNIDDHQFAYGLYWSCDAGLIMGESEEENLKFFVPQGTNLWTDNFAIPVYGKNDAAAHAFIDFLLDPENAMANMDYLGSAMAVTEAVDTLIDEWKAEDPEDAWLQNYIDTVFPTDTMIEHSAVMRNFASDQETKVNNLLISIMNRAAMLDESEGGGSASWLYWTLGAGVLACLIVWAGYALTHRRRKTLPPAHAK